MRCDIYMTFNLKYDFINIGNNSWDMRCNRIAKIIKENNPICIGTQEGTKHMLVSLKNKLEDYDYVGEGRQGGEKGEYNAILYNKNFLELIDWSQFWLSKTPNVPGSKSWYTACSRICTYAKFKNRQSGEEIMVYNTHLDHLSKLAREEGIKIILKVCKENYQNDTIPFIITGDFNCNMNDRVFESIVNYCDEEFIIKNPYDMIEHNIIGTFHDFKQDFKEGVIDYILCSKDFSCKKIFTDEREIDGGYPSDHFPVIAMLES